jgi:hypothetical protein
MQIHEDDMKMPQYENKLKRPTRTVKVRGTTITLIWDGHDWVIQKKASKEMLKDGE